MTSTAEYEKAKQTPPTPDADNAKWIEGYSWALTHLDDAGVLADAARLALGDDL